MEKIIDGKTMAATIRREIAEETAKLISAKGITPGLAVILVGEDPASKIYVRNKIRACKEVGFHSETIRLPADTTQEELLSIVDSLNVDPSIHGILVQSPIPKHLNEEEVVERILPSKDVDGFHPVNAGNLMLGLDGFEACTPLGVMTMLKREGFSVKGKKAVVVGRSRIVGRPMALMLLAADATVTVCHSRTENLAEETRGADILVSAVGKAHMITADMVKPGAVVMDVGMNHDENGNLCGDVDYNDVFPIAGAITPVPGGVGPMTIAMLLMNTLKAAKNV